MKFRDLLKALESGIEFGVARKLRDDEVISLFSVVLVHGYDGNYRAVLRARRLAKPVDDDEIEIRKNGDRYEVLAPAIRIRVRSKKLANAIAEALADGEIQVDVEGPSAKGVDGNPLSAFAQGISTAIGFANLLNAAGSEDEEEEEEESRSRKRKPKPRKKKRRKSEPEDEEEFEDEEDEEELEDEEETESEDEDRKRRRKRVRKAD